LRRLEFREGCPISIPEQLSGRDRLNEAASLTGCPEATFDVAYHRCLVAHYRHDADGNKSCKSKGTCAGLGQINAAAFNIRSSVRDRDRDGITTLLVGDLDLGTKGQRFVRRRHGVVVVRDAAGSFGPTLRRVSHGVHRCDTVFGMNWNVEQTKYERGDQPSNA
jgi:hypothetical protein